MRTGSKLSRKETPGQPDAQRKPRGRVRRLTDNLSGSSEGLLADYVQRAEQGVPTASRPWPPRSRPGTAQYPGRIVCRRTFDAVMAQFDVHRNSGKSRGCHSLRGDRAVVLLRRLSPSRRGAARPQGDAGQYCRSPASTRAFGSRRRSRIAPPRWFPWQTMVLGIRAFHRG